MTELRAGSKATRFWMIFLFTSLFVIVVPYALMAVQAAREAARRKEMRGGRDPVEDFKMLIAMRERYPIVSLGDRMGDQSRTDHSGDGGRSSKLSSETEQQLMEFEKGSSRYVRPFRLSQLHNDTFAEFVQRDGFGIGRMWFGFGWETIRELEPELLPVPIRASSAETSTKSTIPESDPSAAELMHLPNLHAKSFFDFVSPARLGVVPEFKDASKKTRPNGKKGKVTQDWSSLPADSPLRPLSVGHTEHAMTSVVNDAFEQRLTEWQISTLELISLLKAPEPRVYLSRNLPNMKELNGAPTRPVDTFEKAGLEGIRQGEHVVIESDTNEIRMIGAVRATNQCLGCHSVRRGDLLGAFSYSLHRTPPMAAAEQ